MAAQKFVRSITPLFDRVMIERVQASRQTLGGIVLPESVSPKINEGIVVAIGKGKRTPDGTYLPLTVKNGDRVMLNEFSTNEIKINGKDYLLVHEDEILGIVKDTDVSLNK